MRDIGDYPGVSQAHMAVVKDYSGILLIGPPIKRVAYGYRDEEYFFLKIRGAFRLATHN